MSAGDPLPRANALDHLEAVQTGHVQIEQQEVELLRFEALEHFAPGGHDVGVMAPPEEQLSHQIAIEVVVFRDQHAQRHRGHEGGPR